MFVPLYGSGWCTSGPTPSPTVTYRAQLAQKWDNTHAQMPKGAPVLPSATPNTPSYLSVWAMPLSNTCSPMSTHTHSLSTLPSVLLQCLWTDLKTRPGHRHVKAPDWHPDWNTQWLRLFPVVSSIFSSFVFIFDPFACLCGCLHLYLIILWIILVFSHLFLVILHLILAILHLFVLLFFFFSRFAFHYGWFASISCCISLWSFCIS